MASNTSRTSIIIIYIHQSSAAVVLPKHVFFNCIKNDPICSVKKSQFFWIFSETMHNRRSEKKSSHILSHDCRSWWKNRLNKGKNRLIFFVVNFLIYYMSVAWLLLCASVFVYMKKEKERESLYDILLFTIQYWMDLHLLQNLHLKKNLVLILIQVFFVLKKV